MNEMLSNNYDRWQPFDAVHVMVHLTSKKLGRHPEEIGGILNSWGEAVLQLDSANPKGVWSMPDVGLGGDGGESNSA